jgi:hypothetical protein
MRQQEHEDNEECHNLYCSLDNITVIKYTDKGGWDGRNMLTHGGDEKGVDNLDESPWGNFVGDPGIDGRIIWNGF